MYYNEDVYNVTCFGRNLDLTENEMKMKKLYMLGNWGGSINDIIWHISLT